MADVVEKELSWNDFHHPLFDIVNTAEEDETQPSIHALNDECLDLILSYFNTVELLRLGIVCRRWYNLCLSKISRMSYLPVRKLRRQLFIKDDSMSDLDFNSTNIQDQLLELMSTKTESETKLSVSNIMSVVSINCGALSTVTLENTEGLNAESLSCLASMMPNLLELELDEGLEMSEGSCEIMAEKIIPKLEALSFFLESFPDKINLRKMLSSARRLRYLSLEEAGKAEVEEDGLSLLEALSPANPIVCCSFYRHVNLQPKSLEYVLRNFSETLEYLNLSKTNLEGLTNMQTYNLPKLRKMRVFLASLTVRPRHRQDDLEELPLARHTPCSRQLTELLMLMPNLTVLDLSYNYHLRFNGVDIVRLLSEHCPLLEELHLAKCAVPAQKLAALTELKFLKRLFLGLVYHCCMIRGIDEENNLVDCFSFISRRVIPHMKNLEELSIEDPRHAFSVDDIVTFIDHAGPNFKTLTLSALYDIMSVAGDIYNRHNFIEEAARKCKESCKDRNNVITLLVNGIGMMHKNMCNSRSLEISNNCDCRQLNFDDIAPKFLKIKKLEFNHELGYKDFYSNNIAQQGVINIDYGLLKLPRFLQN